MLDTTTTLPTTTAEPVTMAPFAPPPTHAEAINAAHQRVREAGRSTLRFAQEAGEHLLAAKEQCAHGAFKAWVEANCAFSYRQAAKYMQVAKSAPQGTFDADMGINAFLDHLTADMPPEEDIDTPATTPKAKSSTSKVSELKAEIARLAGAVERLSGELQEARGHETAFRDALATAEAHIKTLQEASGGPVVSLDDACGLHDAPPASPFITAEELATLRQEVADLNEMLNDADKGKAELREEVKDLHRKLKLATAASPKAALALRPKDLDENGLDMNDARNW